MTSGGWNMLIEMKEIFKIYKPGVNEVRALDGINLQIEEGEFVSIIGQSGSGKSTLMNIMGCLDIPTRGKYFLGGDDVSTLEDNRLSEIRNREIGFIFQGFNLIPSLDALENVELPLIYRGMAKQERQELAVKALRRVGLGNRLRHRPSEMSGGQQQRAAIARAIAASPPLILADEPTGNLDTKAGMEVMEILMELNQEGRTVVLITHDSAIAEIANRTIRIKDGKIVQDYERPDYQREPEFKGEIQAETLEDELAGINGEQFNEMLQRYLEWQPPEGADAQKK